MYVRLRVTRLKDEPRTYYEYGGTRTPYVHSVWYHVAVYELLSQIERDVDIFHGINTHQELVHHLATLLS